MTSIPTYKKIKKIAVACCRASGCLMLINDKCTGSCESDCKIEELMKKLSNNTSKIVNKSGVVVKTVDGLTYVQSHIFTKMSFDPYKKSNCISSMRYHLNRMEREAEARMKDELFWKEHEKERVWDKSYREMHNLGRYDMYHHACDHCPNTHNGVCLKWSEERICYAEERCKKYGQPFSTSGSYWAYQEELRARKSYIASLDDGSIEGYYASSSVRGGWTGD
jgi:hypothetical protein